MRIGRESMVGENRLSSFMNSPWEFSQETMSVSLALKEESVQSITMK